ncbi:hypothetical protein AXF42_Ash019851 [Apostasia shenzhenica]|uniref:Uncharacterized protein n=1 Tax=Apostasia shenzhenica TaxID=1088818 RepID=A0A2I0ARH4_9ASPA|nr:hypothetical protein AXF42_Ash019851 [Apostasia shenzhenica]
MPEEPQHIYVPQVHEGRHESALEGLPWPGCLRCHQFKLHSQIFNSYVVELAGV